LSAVTRCTELDEQQRSKGQGDKRVAVTPENPSDTHDHTIGVEWAHWLIHTKDVRFAHKDEGLRPLWGCVETQLS
jgi:hypothetical protein